ncbi:hypothetical protein LINPERPRIM_LOCUS3295 [Linum perenne]
MSTPSMIIERRLLDKGGRVTFGIDGIVGMVPGSGGNPDRVGMLCRGGRVGFDRVGMIGRGRVCFGGVGMLGRGGNPGMGKWVMRPLHYNRPDYDGDHTGKLFTIELHYGGVMIGDAYRYGHIAYMDLVDPDKLSLHELNKMVEYLGVYGGIFEYLWLFLGKNSQMG